MIIRNLVEELSDTQQEATDLDGFLKMLDADQRDIDVKGEKIIKEAVVYSCVRIRCETVAKLPLKVYKGNSKVNDHYLNNLLRLRPNPYMTAYTYHKTVETMNCIHGNAYVYIDFNRKTGKVKGLYPLENTRVKIYVDDVGIYGKANKLYYVYTDKLGKRFKLMPYEILHFIGGITFNGIIGLPPSLYLQGLIENSKASQDYLNNFYKNGLQTKGIIQYVGDLDKNAQEQFLREFESMSSGLKNAHKVSLLPFGYQFQPISASLVDAQFLENTKLSAKQIASAYGVKLHQINELEKATYNNVEQSQKDFYIETMQPILTGYEQEYVYKLFLDKEIEENYWLKFNVDAILRSDPKTRAETNKIFVEGGIKLPNEARADEDLEPLPGGDTLLGNGNLIPLAMAGIQYLSKIDTGLLDEYIEKLKEVKK